MLLLGVLKINYKILNQTSLCGTTPSDTTGCDCTSTNSSCCEPISINKKEVPCPICGKKGMPVENVTVKYMVKKELMDKVSDDDDYSLCMSEECKVAYYTESNVKFNKEDIKVPIHFKKDADPKYTCYCNNITEEQVIETVVNKGLDNMKDIIVSINGKVLSQCKVKNPTGQCCTQAFNEAIRKGMNIRNKKK